MIKTLTAHGNSAALIIDKAILEILKIDMSTPLEIVTDGQCLIISPIRGGAQDERIAKSLEKVNARHSETLKRLAG
jgi:antitoxin component of MazEF toxin-antitoxin module